jgi:hypothetical protein
VFSDMVLRLAAGMELRTARDGASPN